MTYAELLRAGYEHGYTRVERDDRLLDVFPAEDREKGIELWEKWDEHEVSIVRVRVPFVPKNVELFRLYRTALEGALARNVVRQLDDFEKVAVADAVLPRL